MKTAIRPKVDTVLRDEWLHSLDGLRRQIEEWLQQGPKWAVEPIESKNIEESYLGSYNVPVWNIVTPEGEARLEPIARNYPGRGIVELYAWPTAYRVRLIRSNSEDEWRVLTDSGIYLHQPWDQEHFVTLMNDLIGADDMIPVG